MTYGAEILIPTSKAKNKVATAHTEMKMYKYVKDNISGLKYKHIGKKRDEVICVIEQIKRRKWILAGCTSRIRDITSQHQDTAKSNGVDEDDKTIESIERAPENSAR